MSMDNNTTHSNGNDDTPMFAATPSWDRAGKKRRFGRSSPEAAAAAPMASSTLDKPFDDPAATVTPTSTLDAPLGGAPMRQSQQLGGVTPVSRPVIDPVVETDPIHDAQLVRETTTVRHVDTVEAPMAAPPVAATRTTPARKGIPVAAIAAGVVALGGLAAAGWYASQPKEDVATLTPGAPGDSAMIAPAPPVASTLSANTTAPPTVIERTTTTTRTAAPAVRRTATTTTQTAAVRTRPAVADTGASVDASAALPATPQSYGSGATANPPAQASNVPTTPAVEPAPAPSASTATPATPAPEPQAAPDASTTP